MRYTINKLPSCTLQRILCDFLLHIFLNLYMVTTQISNLNSRTFQDNFLIFPGQYNGNFQDNSRTNCYKDQISRNFQDQFILENLLVSNRGVDNPYTISNNYLAGTGKRRENTIYFIFQDKSRNFSKFNTIPGHSRIFQDKKKILGLSRTVVTML